MFRPAFALALLASALATLSAALAGPPPPNIILILANDLGYGDLSCYGATRVHTPHIDALAQSGLRFTDAHASAATCTPSRFSILTGEYPFRQRGTGILPGDASLIVSPDRATLPNRLQKAGYKTGAVGKWHLGLGPKGQPLDWNTELKPGPREVGFDYSFIMPATADRVPCVFVENSRVLGLDPSDPIRVNYQGPLDDNAPTGKSNPELLRMKPSHGHDATIVNGISRIGWMTGGKAAYWDDDTLAETLTGKAVGFIEAHQKEPFFLYFATHDIHVPRVAAKQFIGATEMGPRGDVIAQLDWSTGQIMAALECLHLTANTLVIFTSDNGPVVNDGYRDESIVKLGDHHPAGDFRGGNYSAFEGGTRVPFIASWPGHIAPGAVSNALMCQVDLLATLSHLAGVEPPPAGEARDSQNHLDALLGKSTQARQLLVESADVLALREGAWKYIAPGKGPAVKENTKTESGVAPTGALYDLARDPGEKINLITEQPDKAQDLAAKLHAIEAQAPKR